MPRLAAAAGCRACSGAACGPDASRGFCIEQYAGLHAALSHERSWPCRQTIAVVGPAGDEYARAATEAVAASPGVEAVRVSSEPKSRWQSVRCEVLCDSPDDFCELHSRLSALDGTKAVI